VLCTYLTADVACVNFDRSVASLVIYPRCLQHEEGLSRGVEIASTAWFRKVTMLVDDMIKEHIVLTTIHIYSLSAPISTRFFILCARRTKLRSR